MSEPLQTLYRIEGNSYPVRDQLKALGARWDGKDKHWWIHQDRLKEAQEIVGKAPPPRQRKPFVVTCPTCGCKFDVNNK